MTPEDFPVNNRVIERATDRYVTCGIQRVENLIQQKPWYKNPKAWQSDLYIGDINRLASELLPTSYSLIGSNTGTLYSNLSYRAKDTLRLVQRTATAVFGSLFLLEHENYKGSAIIHRAEIEDPIKNAATLVDIQASIFKTGVRFSTHPEIVYGLPDFFVVQPNGVTIFYDAHIWTAGIGKDDSRRHLDETRRTASEQAKQRVFSNAISQRSNFPFTRAVFNPDMHSLVLTTPSPKEEHWDTQCLGYDCVIYAGVTTFNRIILGTVAQLTENIKASYA